MGRPSRKRPRPLPCTEEARPASSSASLESWAIAGLRSLVTSPRQRETQQQQQRGGAKETSSTVQNVWGALSEADIVAAAPSSLRVGANVEVDKAGLAWLVNASMGERGHQHPGHSFRAAAERNQEPRATRNPPQHCCTPDHQAAAAAAVAAENANGTPLPEHDHGEAGPPSTSAPFCACEASLRERLSRAKFEFEEIPAVVFKRVRSACNPAEPLGSGSFLNRSAMKLANIDAVVSGLLALAPAGGPGEAAVAEGDAPALAGGGGTDGPCREAKRAPRLSVGAPGGDTNKALLFADLCGGPGGFSEYLLRRRRQLGLPAKGWGISLREAAAAEGAEARGGGEGAEEDPCAWKLGHLRPWCDVSVSTPGGAEAPPAAPESSGRSGAASGTRTAASTVAAEASADADDDVDAACPLLQMRIDYGPQGTGDLTDEANVHGFVDTVLASTAGRRLDSVVADGGFVAARDAQEQEALLSPLVHCEVRISVGARISSCARGGRRRGESLALVRVGPAAMIFWLPIFRDFP